MKKQEEYKALTSFVGKVSMNKGEVKALKDAEAKPLLKAGLIKIIDKEDKDD